MQRISLSNAAFEGDNNVFVLDDGPETALVDTGDGTEATRRELADALGGLGLSFSDVDRVFLTHWHGDHAGLAGHVQSESGAEVYVHAADAPLVAQEPDAVEAFRERQSTRFEEWGMPAEQRETLRAWLDEHEVAGAAPDVSTFEDGDTFVVNGTELTVAHRPGHTAGLCLLECDLDGPSEVFCGDAILPVYTPNIGGADVRVERPLPTYLRSLEAIAEAEYDRAWPGHRDPIDDPSGRAREIIDHHGERAWRVLDALDRVGPATAWEVSADLFGDLHGVHVLHGPGEADAHLDHLAREGEIAEHERTYRLTAETERRLASTETEHWPLAY